MKKFNMILALILATQTAFAGVITDDNLDLGKPSSSATKSLTFKGPTKKKLSSTSAGVLGYDGNSQSLGDGTNTANKLFEFNKGGTNPFWKYDFATGEMQTGNSTAISHGENTLKVGDGTNSNKVLKFNKGASSPEIRYNSTTSKLEFSNDASIYKAIGSGTGSGDGGINLLTNPSFEDGISVDWSNTGGTFTQGTYTNGTESDTKYANFVASASGQYFETALKVVPDSLGSTCMADIKYFGGSGNFKIQALDSSAVVLSETTLPNVTSWKKSPLLAFTCPNAGATMRLRVISTGAGTIQGDLGYIGGNKAVSQLSQAKLVGTFKVVGTASCNWATTSLTYVNFGANASCPLGTATGDLGAVGTKIPAFTLAAKPGTYFITARGAFFNQYVSGVGSSFWRFSDGTNNTAVVTVHNSATSQTQSGGMVQGELTYASAQTVTINLQAKAEVSGISATAYSDNPDSRELNISVYYFPTNAAESVNYETSGYYVDATITGGDPSLGAATVTTETEITEPSLVMTQRPGSASVGIPCSSTNTSTVGNLTCPAGNEGLGITFNAPYAGRWDVCTAFTHQVDNNAATSGVEASFQLVETPNNAQTILQTGGNTRTSGMSIVAGSGDQRRLKFPHELCGTFNFATAGQKTIRLMYLQTIDSIAPLSSLILANSAGTLKRNVRVWANPTAQNFPAPVFTELQNLLKDYSFAAESTSGQSIPANTNTTVIMNQEKYDPLNIHDNTTGIATLPVAGKYTCQCRWAFASFTPTANIISAFLTKNGSNIGEVYQTVQSTTNNYSNSVTASFVGAQGDLIRCNAFQNTSGTRTIHTSPFFNEFSCQKTGN